MKVIDKILLGLSATGMIALMYLVFMVVPADRAQGIVQKVFYVHVPAAWVAFTAFGVTGFFGLRYLMTRDLRFDRLAASSAEVGVYYITMVLITGPLWAKPIWGIFWTWDLRLTTSFILWLLYLAYLILRRSVGDRERRAQLSAVVGLISFLDVPIVYMANRVRASQHPAPVVGGGEGSGLEPIMLFTLLFGLFVFSTTFVLLLRARNGQAALEDEIEQLYLQRD
ncbi:cytochrome C assembly protein [bacterium]|nr:MAG: cytochrome C assembly protein [bacterium]